MRRARSGNNSDGGPVEVRTSILEGKGPAGLCIKKAEGKKGSGGGNELVISEPNPLAVMSARIASPQSSRQAHRDRWILQSAQKHG
jgi:hypothetical protein